MKSFLIFAGIIFISLPCFSKSNDASAILNKVLNRLNGLKTIRYTYKRILDYPDEKYHDELSANSYLDFNPSAQFIGLRYQFCNNDMVSVYNGSESFYCDKKGKTISINNSPDLNSFKNSSQFFNSPLTLKNALPGIIADNEIPKSLYDTTIANKKFYVADIVLKNKTLNSTGDYVPTTMALKFSYKIIIDKQTFMPVEVLQHTLNNKDTNRTLFADIDFSPATPAETSWYSSSYSDYTVEKPKGIIDLIKPGTQAPESQLVFLKDEKTAAISDFKGKIILLEFWIKDCGHCIEDVPQLNALYDKYKDKNFKLLALNTHDTKSMMEYFVSRHKVKFDVLTGSNKIDVNYGVYGYPSMVLLDKDGIVLYSGELDEKKLGALIDQHI